MTTETANTTAIEILTHMTRILLSGIPGRYNSDQVNKAVDDIAPLVEDAVGNGFMFTVAQIESAVSTLLDMLEAA